MPNWKILPALKSLVDNEEAIPFRTWLISSDRMTEAYQQKLFDIMVEAVASDQIDQLDDERCWAYIRPDHTLDKGKLAQYRKELLQKIERFWLEQYLDEEDNELIATLKLRIFAERGLHMLFNQAHDEYDKLFEQAQLLGPGRQYLWYQMAQLWDFANGPSSKSRLSQKEIMFDRLVDLFLSEYLRNLCSYESSAIQLEDSYSPPLSPAIFSYFKKEYPQKGEDQVYLWLLVYRFLKEEEDNIAQILNLLSPGKHLLFPVEVETIFNILQNGLVRRMNQGQMKKWGPAWLMLFQWGVDQGYLLMFGQIKPSLFRNAVIIAVKLEQYKLALSFLEDYKPHLQGEQGAESFRYSLAYYYYGTRNYQQLRSEEAFSPLFHFKNELLQIESRLLLVRANYEQYWGNGYEPEIDELRLELPKIKRFVKNRKTVSERQKAHFFLTLDFMKRLLNTYSEEQMEELYREIKETIGLPSRQWFLNQLVWRMEG